MVFTDDGVGLRWIQTVKPIVPIGTTPDLGDQGAGVVAKEQDTSLKGLIGLPDNTLLLDRARDEGTAAKVNVAPEQRQTAMDATW